MTRFSQSENRLLIVIFILIILGFFAYQRSKDRIVDNNLNLKSEKNNKEALELFLKTDDNAKAVFVYDATTDKILYEKNADEAIPLASIAKLATAITANILIPENQKITISDKSLLTSGDNGLIAGEVWNRDDLLGFMLVVSSNDAAMAIKESYEKSGKDFIKEVNSNLQKIGLDRTTVYTPSGLDTGGRPGAIGSASDVAKLALYFLEAMPDIAKKTTMSQSEFRNVNGKSHFISNTNDLTVQIDNLLASKTGYTNLAGGNLVIVYRVPVFGNTVVIVVLGSTKNDRFVDISRYMEGVENYYKISQN